LSDSDRKDGPGEDWPAVDRRGQVDRRGIEREAAGHRTRRSGYDRRDESAWESVPLELTLASDKDEVLASEQTLVAAAKDARTRAHARYSGFKVGAALETTEGQIVSGCNIENATYGLTLCAERVALVKALSDGHSIFTRIAVVADTEDPTPPCGPCRQLLWEYCGDIDVILANLERTTATLRLSTLLPMPFDNRLLE
jgi:cytidine deaminase